MRERTARGIVFQIVAEHLHALVAGVAKRHVARDVRREQQIFRAAQRMVGGQRLRHDHVERRAGDRHPLMLVVVTRLILPITLVVGLYIFLRGHNTPGGGFIAGLVVAIALVSQYMASGYAWAQERQKIQYHALIGAGGQRPRMSARS